jgi:hypothetical protein
MHGEGRRIAMIPVKSLSVDHLVPQTNQFIATGLTTLIAAVSVLAVLVFCVRRRIAWPLLIVVSGTATFLLEPLYDHLYGLWFFAEGQRSAVVTYGIHVPIWLPIIYVAYYGCTTIWYWSRFERGISMRAVFLYFTISVLLAGACEIFYINLVGLYNYQDSQPFVLWNYPIFVAIINGVPPFLAAIILYRLVPLLKGWERIVLLGVVPFAFASNTFGSGFLYLAARHSSEHPSALLLHVAAVSAVLGTYAVIWIAAKLAGVGRFAAMAT